MTDKTEARTYSAATESQKGSSPVDWGDKCFLCSQVIGESDPRGFYTGKRGNAMMLAHRGCLNKFEAGGSVPPGGIELTGEPQQMPGAPVQPEEPPLAAAGPMNIRFRDFEHMQDFIVARGPVPDGVKVSVGDLVIRE